MRIALISDIHGNLTALEAALADIERQGADRIVCLGDVAVGGPQPVEVIHRLRDLGIPVIMGNTDDWLLHPRRNPARTRKARLTMDTEMWAAEQMTATERALISEYAPTLPFDLDGLSLICYHASPRNFNDKIRPNTNTALLAKYFKGQDAALFAGGHTHEAMIRRYGESLIINPGSVGAPVIEAKSSHKDAYYPTWAEYALVDSSDGNLSLTLQRVPYPLADFAAAVRASSIPHHDFVLEGWRDATQL
jgi:putative phosphoesterase